jgi:hypothetical protein
MKHDYAKKRDFDLIHWGDLHHHSFARQGASDDRLQTVSKYSKVSESWDFRAPALRASSRCIAAFFWQ